MKKIIVAICLVVFLTGCSKEKKIGEKAIPNNHENVVKEQKINNFTFENVSLIYQGGISTFSVDIYNELQEDVYLNNFKVILKNENGTEITTLDVAVEDTIQTGTSLTMTITSDIDLSDAYSVEYKIG